MACVQPRLVGPSVAPPWQRLGCGRSRDGGFRPGGRRRPAAFAPTRLILGCRRRGRIQEAVARRNVSVSCLPSGLRVRVTSAAATPFDSPIQKWFELPLNTTLAARSRTRRCRHLKTLRRGTSRFGRVTGRGDAGT